MLRYTITKKLGPYASAVLSGILVALPYIYPQLYLFTWLGFVPLLLTIKPEKFGQTYFQSLLMGIVVFSVSTYWIVEFVQNLKGYGFALSMLLAIFYWVYSAHLFVMLFLTFSFIHKHTRIPTVLVFPFVLCFVFQYFPQLFPMRLGESQSHFLIALQGIEFTGVLALDWLIAATNMCFFGIFRQGKTSTRLASACISALFLFWMAFGIYSLFVKQEDAESTQTVRIGIIQPNDDVSIDVPPPRQGFTYAYPREMLTTKAMAAHNIDLIIWPESRFKGYFQFEHVKRAFRAMATQHQQAFMFQDVEEVGPPRDRLTFNTSVMIDKDGEEHRYRKNHLIAFGEATPFFAESMFIRKVVTSLFKDFFTDLSPGKEHAIFRINQLSAIPLICFEALFPEYLANTANQLDTGGFIVVQSSNGWFGQTKQPAQHFNASILRSIEQRLPLVHAMNNGPSGVVLASGKVLFKTASFSEASVIVDIPIKNSPKPTFYARHPQLFSLLITGSCVIFFLYAVGMCLAAQFIERSKFFVKSS